MNAEQYILSLFPGVTDIAKVKPFAGFSVYHPKEVSKTEDLSGTHGALTFKGEDLVSVRTVFIRHAKNPNSETAYILHHFCHPTGQTHYNEAFQLQKDMGGIPGCAMELKPGANGPTSVFLMKESPNYLYLHSSFIKTFMLLNKQNLLNGTIPLSPEICAASEFPKRIAVTNPGGEELEEYDAEFYVLIPYNHVLAWKLKVSSHWRIKDGLFALEMRVAPKGDKEPFILYFAVDNRTFEKLKTACFEGFIKDKHDKRPLSSVGVQVHGQMKQPVTLTTTITYLEYPLNMDSSRLAPVLHEKFIPYAQVLQRRVEAERNLQFEKKRQQEEKKKKQEQEEDTAETMDMSE